MTLKERIKKIIKEKCEGSRKHFADRLGVVPSTIHTWDDEHPPSGNPSKRLREEFNVNIDWLLTGEGEPYIYKDREVSGAGAHHVADPAVEYQAGAPAFMQAVKMLATVLDSGNKIFVQALMSNLVAFSAAINTQQDQAAEIKTLRSECEDLKTRVVALESEREDLRKDITALEDKIKLLAPQLAQDEAAA
jgi:hypothetical protein